LCTDISILGKFNKVELDTLGCVLIFKDGRLVVAREMKGEPARGEVFVNPCLNGVSSITAMTLGFHNQQLASHHVYGSSGSRYRFIAPAMATIHAQKTTLTLGFFSLDGEFCTCSAQCGKV